MNRLQSTWLVGVLLLCASFTFFHHGWSEYDQTKPQDFKATIEESVYENPHVLIKVKYKKQPQTIYLAPTSRMTSRGVSEDMIKKGTSVRLVAYPHKTDKGEMRAERIFINGEKYELR